MNIHHCGSIRCRWRYRSPETYFFRDSNAVPNGFGMMPYKCPFCHPKIIIFHQKNSAQYSSLAWCLSLLLCCGSEMASFVDRIHPLHHACIDASMEIDEQKRRGRGWPVRRTWHASLKYLLFKTDPEIVNRMQIENDNHAIHQSWAMIFMIIYEAFSETAGVLKDIVSVNRIRNITIAYPKIGPLSVSNRGVLFCPRSSSCSIFPKITCPSEILSLRPDCWVILGQYASLVKSWAILSSFTRKENCCVLKRYGAKLVFLLTCMKRDLNLVSVSMDFLRANKAHY